MRALTQRRLRLIVSANMLNEGHGKMDFRSGEFGMVGAEQGDETHYDKSHRDGTERIHFPQDKIYGRDRELKTLQEIYRGMISKDDFVEEESNSKQRSSGGAEIVFISGYSGSGKTRLVDEAVKRFTAMDETKKPIFMHGKYEELQTGDLYRGISEAFGCWYLCQPKESKKSLEYLRGEMQEAVGDDIVVLGELIPAMISLVSGDDDVTISSKASSTLLSLGSHVEVSVNQSRVHFVLQSFVKSLCKQSSPAVLFIDDLQWAEAESLDLLKSLCLDMSIQNFLFVGAFRSNEVHDDHPLMTVMTDMEKESRVTRLDLCDLSREQLRSFIGDTLELEASAVQPLADALFSKTLGNIFFTMQALEQLVRRNALYYDMMIFRWQWVLSTDQLEGLLSNDVVEMVKSKLEHLDPKLQKTLVIAAHLRNIFDLGTLAAAIDTDIYGPPVTETESAKLLDRAIHDGLLARTDSAASYTFFHDRIREAAGSLILGDTRDTLLFHIGNVLAERGISKDGEDWMLFTAVHHLNSLPSQFHDNEYKLRLAELNLEASKASLAIAAFSQAACLSENGIRFLPPDKWTTHRDLCHELYAIAAKALRHTGDIEKMEKYSIDLLSKEKDIPHQKMFPVYYNLAVGLFYGAERHAEAHSIMLRLLNQLDCRFPKGTVTCVAKTISRVLSLPFAKKKRTSEELERIGFMSDPDKFKCMMVLDKLFDICYLMKDETLLPLVIFRAHDYTIKYGVCIYSPKLVAAISMFFSVALNDLKGAAVYANYALNLMAKVNHRSIECGTMMIAYFMGLHWTIPARQCVEPMRRAYMIGTKTGEVENPMWCIFNYTLFSFQAGISLHSIDAAIVKYLPEMEEKSLNMHLTCAKSFWNLTLTLLGRPSDHLSSEAGEHMSEIPVANLIAAAGTRIKQGYFGDYENCANSAVKAGDVRKAAPGGPIPVMDMCVCALSCYVIAQRTGKAKYKSESKSIHKTFKGWVKQGNPNIKHWDHLLDAESAVLRRRNKDVIKSYKSAVSIAKSGGYIHDAAIGCERWGEYMLTVVSDREEAKTCLKESLRLWREWGALGKVQRMKEKYPDLLA